MDYLAILPEYVEFNIVRPFFIGIGVTSGSLTASYIIVYMTLVLVLFQLLSLFSSKGSTSHSGISASSTKKPRNRRYLVLCGPCNSGKTSLFYYLATREFRQTVSSLKINECSVQLESVSSGESKQVQVVDIPGHLHFKEDLISKAEEARTIVLMVDSKDRDSCKQAAEILYDVLSSIEVAAQKTPVVVACNKQDL